MDIDPRQYEEIAVNDNDVHSIVMSYLAHSCFTDTLESFTTSTGVKQTANLEDMEKRKRIYHLALEGSVLKAIELTEQFAPDLLEKNKDLHFDLLSLHFVGLVCSRKCIEALEFAQAKLAPFGKVQKYVEKLEDFMALLAYNEPEKSPMFHLLSLEYGQQVADSLNRAMLANSNLPSYSAVERLMQQTTVVRQCLSQESRRVSSICFERFFEELEPSASQKRNINENCRGYTVKCALAKTRMPPSPASDAYIREPHKYFDEVVITVCAGDGGHGAVLSMPNNKAPSKSQGKFGRDKTKKKASYKRDFDGSIILPMGGHGGDVVLYADESKDSLLEFHNKSKHKAKRGGNVDSMGVLTSHMQNGAASPTLRIPVPLGTVVKLKKGKFLADLANPGDEVLVARGGQGGISLLEVPEYKRKQMTTLTTNIMRDATDKVLSFGQFGEEVSLQLILRVVADVGLVGLPNAGKSTLLAAITHARPDIADYPFTTLMPNLGRLDGDPSLGADKYSSEATLADLPGLIEGAHLGKGLGRNFLRHLRRTRLLVHVVDAAAEDPVGDYRTVKEELRMYNPEYLDRPYLVVLNKIDKPEAIDKLPTLTEEIRKIGCERISPKRDTSSGAVAESISVDESQNSELSNRLSAKDQKVKELEEYPRPLAVVGVSVLKGIKVNEMLKAIRAALREFL
ncbi:hypothetical protein H5410_024669 [Solanum commersonii]|uniref:GTP-binding protein OBGC2 n=1 Tax=Solanum commersonii TaxID=4109 RepID=A0A9J5ZMP7_SOLCO|nr:hypothetical protein H5410_024669 [Solanum commersonii]